MRIPDKKDDQMNAAHEVIAEMVGTATIPRERVLHWISDGDLRTRAAVYLLVEVAWERIQPRMSLHLQLRFMADYLLECLVTDPSDPDAGVMSGFEAAWELQAWMKHLKDMEAEPVIGDLVSRLEELYREGDVTLRNRIETGVLEHVLESKRMRAYFQHWQTDPVLKDAHQLCMQWALEHEEE